MSRRRILRSGTAPKVGESRRDMRDRWSSSVVGGQGNELEDEADVEDHPGCDDQEDAPDLAGPAPAVPPDGVGVPQHDREATDPDDDAEQLEQDQDGVHARFVAEVTKESLDCDHPAEQHREDCPSRDAAGAVGPELAPFAAELALVLAAGPRPGRPQETSQEKYRERAVEKRKDPGRRAVAWRPVEIDDRRKFAPAEANGFSIGDIGGEEGVAIGVAPCHRTNVNPLARMAVQSLRGVDERVAVPVDADLGLADKVRDGEEVRRRAARR